MPSARITGIVPFKKELSYFFVLFVLLVFSFSFDREVLISVMAVRNTVLTSLMLLLSNFLFIGLVFVIATVFMFRSGRDFIPMLWLAVGLSAVSSLLLKLVVARPRPYIPMSMVPIVQESSYSFPSTHAAIYFSALMVMACAAPNLRPAWLVFTSLGLFSRLYLGVHYLSDILGGIILGGIIGYMLVWLEKRYAVFTPRGMKRILHYLRFWRGDLFER